MDSAILTNFLAFCIVPKITFTIIFVYSPMQNTYINRSRNPGFILHIYE